MFWGHVVDCDGEEIVMGDLSSLQVPGYAVSTRLSEMQGAYAYPPVGRSPGTICKGHDWLMAIHMLQSCFLKVMQGNQLF